MGSGRWADLFEEAELDLDSQLLAHMEAREDRERGADNANVETFGQEASSWPYEEQVAANESLEPSGCHVGGSSNKDQGAGDQLLEGEPPPPPPPVDRAWTRTAETLTAEQRMFVGTA